jgi:hypothetical protein
MESVNVTLSNEKGDRDKVEQEGLRGRNETRIITDWKRDLLSGTAEWHHQALMPFQPKRDRALTVRADATSNPRAAAARVAASRMLYSLYRTAGVWASRLRPSTSPARSQAY